LFFLPRLGGDVYAHGKVSRPISFSSETSRESLSSETVQMNVDALLINLRQSSDRMRFQELQFARRGIPFKRLDAAEASSIADDLYADVICAWQRPISRGELSCFLSHRVAWRRVVNSGRSALVVEDGVLLSDNLVPVLSQLDCPDEPVAFNIETCYARKVMNCKANCASLPSGYRIRPIYFDCGGSAAYVATPSVAQLYLDHSKRCIGVVDAYMNRLKHVKRMQIEPALAVQMNLLHESLDQRLAGAARTTLGQRPLNAPADVAAFWKFCRMKLRRLDANIHKLAVRSRTLGHATKTRIRTARRSRKTRICSTNGPDRSPRLDALGRMVAVSEKATSLSTSAFISGITVSRRPARQLEPV
jgi:glycosyl transferase family 25